MRTVIQNPWLKGAIALSLSLVACKQAGYQVLRPETGQMPQNFSGSGTIPPTAGIEVLDRGVSVTWTYVDNKVDVRPTLDTLDPDYIGKSTCDNPGIIEASFDLGNGSKPVSTRSECEALKAGETSFSQPGDYLIQMQVKSLDGEIAWASMTLRVVDKNTPRDQIEGGFTVRAKPILANIGQVISFTGICELKGRITVSWDFADGSKVDGAVVNHAYTSEGQYRVTALCTNDAGKSLQASVTVVVMKENAPQVPDVAVPVPGSNPNIPPVISCDPTQGPCQNGAQMPTNGKATSTSTPVQTKKEVVWYYDPYCRCYWHYN